MKISLDHSPLVRSSFLVVVEQHGSRKPATQPQHNNTSINIIIINIIIDTSSSLFRVVPLGALAKRHVFQAKFSSLHLSQTTIKHTRTMDKEDTGHRTHRTKKRKRETSKKREQKIGGMFDSGS